MVDLSPILALPAPLAVGLSPLVANSLAFSFTAAYVGSLYVAQRFFLKKTEKGDPPVFPPPGHRDHPGTMKLRMKAVSIATRLCLGAVVLLVKKIGGYSFKEAVKAAGRLLGLSTPALDRPIAYLLVPVLFLGPLYGYFLDGELPGQENFGPVKLGLAERRNYVVGPLSEELLFRSAVLSVSILGGFSWKQLVFATPLWFGLAHVHHGLQVFRDQGETARAAKYAVTFATFQTGYTTLFGWIASFLFIRTGSVLPSMAAHIFCNLMGLPTIDHSMQNHPKRKLSIVVSYITGVAGFSYLLTKL